MKAMILAAGRGERMRPLTDSTPKPLLKVGSKSLIVWHLERLAAAGITEVVINHAHLGEQIEAALGDGAKWNLRIQYSPEKHALETAGGIANVLHLLGTKPFLVVNGDTFTNMDFSAIIESALKKFNVVDSLPLTYPAKSKKVDGCENATLFKQSNQTHLAHLIMVNNPPQHLHGDFAIENGCLKHTGNTMLTFSGIGFYHPLLFKEIIKGEPAKLAPLLRLAIDQEKASAQLFEGVWHDIGTPDRLKEINNSLI